MTDEEYIQYHEAGHAIAIYQSGWFAIRSIEATDRGDCVTPSRKPCAKKEDCSSLRLQEAVIAIAGLVSGHQFLMATGDSDFDLQGREESDLVRFFGVLQMLRIQFASRAIVKAVAEYFSRPEVWNQVRLVAGIIGRPSFHAVDGDAVSRQLDLACCKAIVRLPLWVKLLAMLLWRFRRREPAQVQFSPGWYRSTFERILRSVGE